MSRMRILCKLGDSTVTWDAKGAEEAVREAERIFNHERASGSTAFRVPEGGGPAERIDTFDREAEQIVVVPRLAGG